MGKIPVILLVIGVALLIIALIVESYASKQKEKVFFAKDAEDVAFFSKRAKHSMAAVKIIAIFGTIFAIIGAVLLGKG